MRPNSIRARMTTIFVLAVAMLLTLVCSGILLYARSAAERTADAVLRAAADRIDHDAATEGPQAGFEDELPDFRADNIGFLILDRSGKVLRRAGDRIPPWPRSPRDGWRTVTAGSGPYEVVVGMPWEKTAAGLRSLAACLLLVSLCVLVAVGVGAWMLVGRTLKPIDSLAAQAGAASSENLLVQLHASSPDAEVVRLVGTLNDLLARLAETAALRGRFYAAASHELRTPVHALQGHLEMARMGDRTKAEYRDAIDEAYDQAHRLSSLIQELLVLNQLEVADGPPPAETVNVADIVERALAGLQALIRQRGLEIRANGLPDCEIQAPPAHADILVRNLVENAVKYASPSGVLCVGIETGTSRATLEVVNDAAPLPPEVFARLCEPFFRADGARSSETGGNGLGLAICTAIAAANRWEFRLQQCAGGVTATVRFPAS